MTDKKSSDNSSEEEIKKALDKIRPALQADGGDVQFIAFDKDSGTVKVQLHGKCVGCPMSQVTLKQGIEAELKKAVPDVKEVVEVHEGAQEN